MIRAGFARFLQEGDEVFRVAVGHVDADEFQRRRQGQDLLHFGEVGFGGAGGHHHVAQHRFRHALHEVSPLLDAVMFVYGGENVERSQGLGHAEGAHRVHVGGDNRHAGPAAT